MQHAATRGVFRHARLSAVLATLALALLAALLAAPVARGESAAGNSAQASEFSVTKVATNKFPYVRFAFSRDSDDPKLPNFQITENGKVVSNYKAYSGRLGRYESNPKPVVILALDASKTMEGEKFEQAKDAAKALVAQRRDGDRIGLVVFGEEAELAVAPTEDGTALEAAIDAAEISEGTAMHDAVSLAADSFPGDASRSMVVLLADGQDISSKASLEEAVEVVKSEGVEVYAVGLDQGRYFFPQPLRRLSGASGGTFQAVDRAEDLEPVYAELGQSLLRTYWVEYKSAQPGGSTVKLQIEAEGGEPTLHSYSAPKFTGSDGNFTLSAPPTVKVDKPAIALPDGGAGLLVAAAPFGLLLAFVFWLFLQRRSRPDYAKRIDAYTKVAQASLHKEKGQARSGLALLAPLYRATEKLLRGSSLFRRFRRLIEQSNLPLREVELLYMMVGSGIVATLFSIVLLQSLLAVVIFGTIGALLPYVFVRRKARKRRKLFEAQLADMLATVSASLKAGHSFNQSLTAVIKEAPQPMSEELQRVMTEARLGMPIEEALETMAVRMDSSDFEFAVTTVNIQRTVGGSLSEILEMVGDTVRGRQQFRKKVKALTSMGSMSAYVLLGMPIFMAGLLSLMNGEYMKPLWSTEMGHTLLGAGVVFMFLGYIACMKIVRIKI